jgi:hypothetical protein
MTSIGSSLEYSVSSLYFLQYDYFFHHLVVIIDFKELTSKLTLTIKKALNQIDYINAIY